MMFSRVRRRLTYANVVVTLALCFAMSGGAYAANKYLITSTKQISPKVLKSLKGSNGKNGAAGPAGPAGSAGPGGTAGSVGATGPKGETGKEGIAGKEGPAGKEGSPWTAKGTLPAGSSEAGQWAITAPHALGVVFGGGISFSIPLATAPGEAHSHFISLEEGEGENGTLSPAITSGECKGNFEKPQAASGNLCVFASESLGELKLIGNNSANAITNAEEKLNIFTKEGLGAGKSGAVLAFIVETESNISTRGTWAVTG
jgi:hypothetical protein